jgi:hypothetical protein
MKTKNSKQKVKLNFIALLMVLPIALFIYEYIAPQNNHPSVIGKIQALVFMLFPQQEEKEPKEGIGDMKDEEEAIKTDKPPKPKVTPKLSIKASTKKNNDVTKEDNKLKVRSTQQTQTTKDNKIIEDEVLSEGNNLEGELNLPSLSFQGEFTEELLYLMLTEGKAKVISKSPQMGNYEYEVQGNTFKQGRFHRLTTVDGLSDRSIALEGEWEFLLRPRYQRVTLDSMPSIFELRFTTAFNQQLAQHQLQAQQQAEQPLKETAFNISINNNETVFTLVEH